MPQVVVAPAQRHSLHGDGAIWRETNCYTDVWIEVLHALGLEPLAMLGPCLRVTLEADQWTFFKPSFDDLYALYGIDVSETNPWRGLVQTCETAAETGRIALPEVDSWFLPDTAGVSYQLAHVKSTIAVLAIDVATKELSYAHNAGCYKLSGSDFDGLFGLGHYERTADHLPPYVDMMMPPKATAVSTRDLAMRSLSILGRHIARLPQENPFNEWSRRFGAEIEAVRATANGEGFHAYAFTTFRQFGPAFELSARHLHWLATESTLPSSSQSAVRAAAEHYGAIASTALVLQMRTARAVMSGKPLDPTSWMTELSDAWHGAGEALRSFGTLP